MIIMTAAVTDLPAFTDNQVHPAINLDNLDPECELPGLVANTPRQLDQVDAILNNSLGMVDNKFSGDC